MTVRIFQIDIGAGTQWGNEDVGSVIRQIFVPSVRRYAERHGYDYTLITESEYQRTIGTFDFLATREKHYSFERYFHFASDANLTVYMDTDIFVSDDAEPLPNLNGVAVAREPEGRSTTVFREAHGLSDTAPYYNSGVTMADRETAAHLQEYMQDRMRRLDRAKGKNTDNMMLNEYLLQYPERRCDLGIEWNYMPMIPNCPYLERANFVHAVGIDGKNYIASLLATGVNVEEEFKALTSGLRLVVNAV